MIAQLRGIVCKEEPGRLTIDVAGVGYRLTVPVNVWEQISEEETTLVYTSTYVREDRFELYGFLDQATRALFERLIDLNGVGPRMGLELCSVPRDILFNAVHADDALLLTHIKGVGKKTAEKLLLELKSLAERIPSAFSVAGSTNHIPSSYDADAIAALTQLGFATADVLTMMQALPKELATTEERVTAALRNA
jgi:Holliday junction DNA helicase RuvA